MIFIEPRAEELRLLRPDPLLCEQELDVRPDVNEAIELACGRRSGRVYWRSEHDHLYALELADLGRGRPSMATVFGFWDRYEPRPPEHEIDADLVAFSLWVASVCHSLNPEDVSKVFEFAGRARRTSWPEGSVLRTPPECFDDLLDFDYTPRYTEIEGLRMAWVEAGVGEPILLLHGAPAWSYLYRTMIPALAAKGRVIAPDLIGFGRSDKPTLTNAHTCRAHVRWLRKFLDALRLDRITLVGHQWGGFLGLRLAGLQPRRFRRIVAINTGLPDGSVAAGPAPSPLHVLPGAYQAPFPTRVYQTAPLVFPRLFPTHPDAPGVYENLVALEGLRNAKLPTLLLWGARDAASASWMEALRRALDTPESDQIEEAGHWLPDEKGEEAAARIAAWLARG